MRINFLKIFRSTDYSWQRKVRAAYFPLFVNAAGPAVLAGRLAIFYTDGRRILSIPPLLRFLKCGKCPGRPLHLWSKVKKVGQIKTETAFTAGDFETAEITERLPGQTGIFQPTVQTTAENQESARPAV